MITDATKRRSGK